MTNLRFRPIIPLATAPIKVKINGAIPSLINGGGGGACESMMSRIYSMTYISIASISMISI